MTHQQAVLIFDHHHIETKSCTTTGYIWAQSVSTHRDHPGPFIEWHEVELTTAAIREWLGY